MSRTPYGDASIGKAPTASLLSDPDRDVRILQNVASKRLPHGKTRPSTPRAAFSHSSSVGSRYERPTRRPSQRVARM
jgi:hypothetical protein